jgi:hypothetical protein
MHQHRIEQLKDRSLDIYIRAYQRSCAIRAKDINSNYAYLLELQDSVWDCLSDLELKMCKVNIKRVKQHLRELHCFQFENKTTLRNLLNERSERIRFTKREEYE